MSYAKFHVSEPPVHNIVFCEINCTKLGVSWISVGFVEIRRFILNSLLRFDHSFSISLFSSPKWRRHQIVSYRRKHQWKINPQLPERRKRKRQNEWRSRESSISARYRIIWRRRDCGSWCRRMGRWIARSCRWAWRSWVGVGEVGIGWGFNSAFCRKSSAQHNRARRSVIMKRVGSSLWIKASLNGLLGLWNFDKIQILF